MPSSERASTPGSLETDGGQDLDAGTERCLEVCRAELSAELSPHSVTLGFDGAVDSNRELIDERTASSYVPVERLRDFGQQVVDSADADSSMVVEWTTTSRRTGGHTAQVGGAYDALGLDLNLIGTYGRPTADIFAEEFAEQTLVSMGRPARSNPIEFADKKLIIVDLGPQRDFDWASLVDRAGLDTLVEHVDGAEMLSMGYWAVITSMPDIWDGLREEVWPRLDDPPSFVLVDPFDVRQVPLETLADGRDPAAALDATVPVTMCANRAETYRLAEVVVNDAEALSLAQAADAVRDGFGITEYAAHAIDGGVYATPSDTYRITSPYTSDPEMTTSAGDHFAAGLALGKLEQLDPRASLVLAAATAGAFVRAGESPTYDDIIDFVERYETFF